MSQTPIVDATTDTACRAFDAAVPQTWADHAARVGGTLVTTYCSVGDGTVEHMVPCYRVDHPTAPVDVQVASYQQLREDIRAAVVAFWRVVDAES